MIRKISLHWIWVLCIWTTLFAAALNAFGQAPAPVNAQTINVQALVNAAPSGTVIALPEGVFPVHRLTFKSGVSLTGAGESKTIIQTEVTIPDGCQDVSVSGLTLQNSNTNYLVFPKGHSSDLSFQDVDFDQAAGLPPLLRNCSGLTVSHCRFDGWHTWGGAPSFDWCDNLVETGCVTLHRSGRATYRYTTNALVTHCQDIWSNEPSPAHYTEVGGADVSWSSGDTFESDYFAGVGPPDTQHNSGEAFLAQDWPYPIAAWPYHPVVVGLTVKGCRFQNSHYAVELYDGGVDCAFTHNTLIDVPGFNLRGDFTHGRNFPVTGCTIKGNTILEPSGQYPGTVVLWQQGGGVNGANNVSGNSVEKNTN